MKKTKLGKSARKGFEEEKLDTSEISIEQAHEEDEKKTGQKRQIVVQFSSYRKKLII